MGFLKPFPAVSCRHRWIAAAVGTGVGCSGTQGVWTASAVRVSFSTPTKAIDVSRLPGKSGRWKERAFVCAPQLDAHTCSMHKQMQVNVYAFAPQAFINIGLALDHQSQAAKRWNVSVSKLPVWPCSSLTTVTQTLGERQ